MGKGRLEAFSDGVIAVIITIMVLELKVPHGEGWQALRPLAPTFGTYVLSFMFIGTYWNNHHHLLHATSRVNGTVLWANLHLLFWLSLVPVVTGWMGESHAAPAPTAAYGVVLLASGVAYLLLQTAIVRAEGAASRVRAALGSDFKGKASAAAYVSAVGLAFVWRWAAVAIYAAVALWWLVPDRRIEAHLAAENAKGPPSGEPFGETRSGGD